MIVIAKKDTTVPEAWMRQPLAIQEIVAELRDDGASLYLRIEDPAGTPRLVDAFPCETVDATLPASWVGTERSDRRVVFGPEAWQEPTFWDDYAAGDAAVRQRYAEYSQPKP